ncbi:hypothetical protein PPGU19_072010 (plasmid) [Paraburkholderia sp. PGU19]|uniref:hypothetical protein n=1 Tax=Paraburkholderia sp. PGU19 TaxID=2735434 RepID=UPI0015DC6B9E|nr:hypothetical protein [Paraburkholderia sp. PGU19]BCG02633.1 hypothetical protein PPGU19_072010 [Paraburkholderia sp. PGU19]
MYISDEHFMAIREWLMKYEFALHKDTPGQKTIVGKMNTGPMMQCFIELLYLTCQRSTEIRPANVGADRSRDGVIHFVPTKTAESSGEAVDWPITPGIDTVLNRARRLEPAFG